MPEARLILVRHGQTAHNHDRRLQGHLDIPLDAVGQAQAGQLARHLRGLGVLRPVIHSSDLSRAAGTAQALHAELGGALHLFPTLREIHLGVWEGQRHADLAVSDAERFTRFWAGDPHGGAPDSETPHAVGERLHAHLSAHWPPAGATLVLVSHGIALSALLTRLLGLDYRAQWQSRALEHRNTAYSVLTVQPDTRAVLAATLAQAPHLEAAPAL